jgi:hypothetical protein
MKWYNSEILVCVCKVHMSVNFVSILNLPFFTLHPFLVPYL